MLRTIRLTTAIVCFTLITLLFLDFTGTLHTWFGWLAKIQFLPALLDKLRQDYEAALKTLDSIPPEVIRFYKNRSTQEPAMRHDK